MTPTLAVTKAVNELNQCVWNSKWLQLSAPGGCWKNGFQASAFGRNDGILWAIMLYIFVIHHNL